MGESTIEGEVMTNSKRPLEGGAMKLPNRNYIKHKIRDVFQNNPGITMTLTTIWNHLSATTQRVIVEAYEDTDKARMAVYRSIQNWQRSAGNPKQASGRGQDSTWVYQEYGDHKPKVEPVFTTETPEDVIEKVKTFRDYDIPATPIDETFPQPAYVDPDDGTMTEREKWGLDPADLQVGDKVIYTLIGKFLDGTYLWREESTSHVGTMGDFVAL
jgi:hypothetical protein